MLDGKRGAAEKALYGALKGLEEETGKDGLEVLEQALKNIMPVLEVKARRVGGANYQVPVEVRPDRKETLGIRWLVTFARKRGEKTTRQRLAAEIKDAFNNTGGAVKKKEDTHKMAEANKAFAHYRW
jgi:small subunit ribosomal protein S7